MLSDVASFSAECLASDESEIPRAVIRSIVSIAIPVSVVILYALFWLILTVALAQNWDYLKQRLLLSFLAVAYLTYVWVTKTAVDTLYCIQVHDSFDVDVDSTSRYWAHGTSLKCYEGSHTVLASTGGWPVLIGFSIGFPIFMACKLRKSKDTTRTTRSTRGWFIKGTVFFYRAYSDRFVYWESLTMLRKALLTIVVAFGYHLGPNLQSILAVCVLTTALYIHTVCHPFRQEFNSLNIFEEASLCVSNVVFVMALFFHDRRVKDGVLVFLSVLFFVLICGMCLTLVVAFLRATLHYMRIVLEIEKTSDAKSFSFLRVFREFSAMVLGRGFAMLKRKRRKPRTDDATT